MELSEKKDNFRVDFTYGEIWEGMGVPENPPVSSPSSSWQKAMIIISSIFIYLFIYYCCGLSEWYITFGMNTDFIKKIIIVIQAQLLTKKYTWHGKYNSLKCSFTLFFLGKWNVMWIRIFKRLVSLDQPTAHLRLG